MENLIKAVQKKTSGFDYESTKTYYRRIVEKAWVEVEGADTPEVAIEKATNNEDWLLLDNGYRHRFAVIGTTRWRSGTSPHGISGGAGGNSFVNWSEGFVKGVNNVSKSVVTNLESFTHDIVNITNPPPPSSSGRGFSGGGFSGGGGACACACACACAGGGR